MKRFLSVLLVAILIVTSLATVAFAATEVKTGDVKTFTVTVSNIVEGDVFGNYGLELKADSGLKIIGISDNVTTNSSFTNVSWAKNSNVTEHSFDVTVKVTAINPGTYDVDVAVLRATKFIGVENDTEDGIADGWVKTSVSANGASFVIPEPECEHDFGDWYTVVEADCVNGGSERRDCANCDYYETRDTDPLGHDLPENWTTVDAADCENGGTERRDCSRCDYFETRDTDPLGHAWGEWEIVKKATCTEDGLKKRVCGTCGEIEEQVIPSEEGHTWSEWETVKKATCTEDGLKKRVCGSCGEKQEEVIAATGHAIDEDWEYDSKSHWHVCTKCGEKFDHDDHDLKELENSKGQKYKKCSVCPYATNPEGDVLDDVPQTGDITPMITTGVLVLIAMICTAAIVFKRKRAN